MLNDRSLVGYNVTRISTYTMLYPIKRLLSTRQEKYLCTQCMLEYIEYNDGIRGVQDKIRFTFVSNNAL